MTRQQVVVSLGELAKRVYFKNLDHAADNSFLLPLMRQALDVQTSVRGALIEAALNSGCLNALNSVRHEHTDWLKRSRSKHDRRALEEITRFVGNTVRWTLLEMQIEGYGCLGDIVLTKLPEIAEAREGNARGNLTEARFLRELHRIHPVNAPVRKHFTAKQLRALWEKCVEHVEKQWSQSA